LLGVDRPQDLRHTKILLKIVPGYLNEFAVQYRRGVISEQNLLGAIRYTESFLTASFAGNAGRSHRLALDGIFPNTLEMTGPQSVREAIAGIRAKVPAMLAR
jgi:hypothetical protein